jgi:hypothetical protein
MRTSWLMLFCAGLVFTCAHSQHEPAPEVEEVVVTGEQPGPQLWKATKDDHVLWIYGTVTPKPRGITWRSKQVASVLDHTQEIINQQLQGTSLPANVVIELDSINPVKQWRTWGKISDLRQALAPPPLKETVPPHLYERFRQLKARYMPGEEWVESTRPRVAANRLFEAAVEASRLTSRQLIHDEVHRLARKRHIEVNEVTLRHTLEPDALQTIYREFSEIPAVTELDCFEATLALVENEMPTITARANAWAIGDVEALRKLPSMRREACDRAQWNTPRWADLDAQLETLWLNTVDAAVKRNAATLVLVDVAEIFEPNGVISKLVARGYQLEGP